MAMQLATYSILIKSKKLHILPNLVIEWKFLDLKSEKNVKNVHKKNHITFMKYKSVWLCTAIIEIAHSVT